jgi:2-keto-3-deoxy-L-rhamnonate aldolase RhmA
VVRVSATVSPLKHGALAAAVRAGTSTLGTFIGMASPVAAEVCATAARLEQGWSFVGIGSDATLLAAAVSTEFGLARAAAQPD